MEGTTVVKAPLISDRLVLGSRKLDYVPGVSTGKGLITGVVNGVAAVGFFSLAAKNAAQAGMAKTKHREQQAAKKKTTAVRYLRETKGAVSNLGRAATAAAPFVGNSILLVYDDPAGTRSSGRTGKRPVIETKETATVLSFERARNQQLQKTHVASIPTNTSELTIRQSRLMKKRVISLERLGQLTTVHLASCILKALPTFPRTVSHLTLEECKLIGSGKQPFRLNTVGAVSELVLKSCVSGLFIDLAHASDCKLRVLRCADLEGQKVITDGCFGTFPKGLKEVYFSGCGISDHAIEKLPRDLTVLSVIDCPNVTMIPERAGALFKKAQLTGLERRPSKSVELLDKLQKRVIGQHDAVFAVYEALCRVEAKMNSPGRPMAILYFNGMSGVGKTELAHAIADITGRQLVRLDMTEYQEKHEISRLFGSPPGYEGNGEGGQLTEQVSKTPTAVVLLDEFEKCHPAIQKACLPIFDAGRLTDGRGKVVNFEKTIIILTANLGASAIAALDWKEEATQAKAVAISRQMIKEGGPEFLGRLDAVIPFRPLDKQILRSIVLQKVQTYASRLAQDRRLQIDVDSEVWDSHLRENIDPDTGARPVIRAIEREISTAISEAMLRGYVKEGDSLSIFRTEEGDLEVTLESAGSLTKGKEKV